MNIRTKTTAALDLSNVYIVDPVKRYVPVKQYVKSLFLSGTAKTPGIKAPDGLLFESVNPVIKGICNECPKFAT
jgi:hypothetical protein